MRTIYLSSTFADLEAHRAAVYRALHRARYEVTAMEDYVARDDRMVDACLGDVEEKDLCILLVARRYGHVPPDENPDGRSITHLEYLKAREAGKPVLIFLLDPQGDWDERHTDTVTGENDGGERLAAFRAELERRAFGLFREPADLAEAVLASVRLEEAAARRRALPQELGSASSLTMMESGVPEIISKIERAIAEPDKPQIFQVDLGAGDRWWSTRLLLLAALCRDYTEVRRFAFTGPEKRFLGMCRPHDVRRALAAAAPAVEDAYRRSRPAAGAESPDPLEDVHTVVSEFSGRMDELGGEPEVKYWVPAHVVQHWPGFDPSALEVADASASPALLGRITEQETDFVALVRNHQIVKIVDRANLVDQLARAALDGIEDR